MREAVTPPLPRTTLDMLSCVSRNAIARSVPLGLTGPVRANRERSRVAVAGGAATRSARMAMVSVREGPRARLHDLFDYWAREQPADAFVVAGGRSLSYADAARLAEQVGKPARGRGLRQRKQGGGPRQNADWYLLLNLAAAKAGLALLLINWRLAPREWVAI